MPSAQGSGEPPVTRTRRSPCLPRGREEVRRGPLSAVDDDLARGCGDGRIRGTRLAAGTAVHLAASVRVLVEACCRRRPRRARTCAPQWPAPRAPRRATPEGLSLGTTPVGSSSRSTALIALRPEPEAIRISTWSRWVPLEHAVSARPFKRTSSSTTPSTPKIPLAPDRRAAASAKWMHPRAWPDKSELLVKRSLTGLCRVPGGHDRAVRLQRHAYSSARRASRCVFAVIVAEDLPVALTVLRSPSRPMAHAVPYPRPAHRTDRSAAPEPATKAATMCRTACDLTLEDSCLEAC